MTKISPINILIVDNSEKIIVHLKNMLTEIKNISSVYSAASSADAKVIIKNLIPDIVITDILLADGANGMDLLKWITAFDKQICTIIFTNSSDNCHRTIAKENGARFFLDKSFEFEKLPSLINNYILENDLYSSVEK